MTVRLTRYATYPRADIAPSNDKLGVVVLVDDSRIGVTGPWPWHRPPSR